MRHHSSIILTKKEHQLIYEVFPCQFIRKKNLFIRYCSIFDQPNQHLQTTHGPYSG